MNIFSSLRELNFVSMMFRMFCAMLAGGIIGLEREQKGRPAGFRTYMLVALGASLTMMLGQYLSLMLSTKWIETTMKVGLKTDVVRTSAEVINGVGFLGAGTILVTSRQEVKGLTTAAALWASASLGIACGAGFYECVFVGFVLIILCMALLPKIEKFMTANAVNMGIYVETDNIESIANVISHIKAENIRIIDVEIDKVQQASLSQINALINICLPKRMPHSQILTTLATLDGIISIEQT